MFERFTERSRKIMALANQEAENFWHEYIGTEHILLGLIKEGTGVGANVLKALDVDLAKVRSEIEKLVQRGQKPPTGGKLPQTPRSKKVIENAISEAISLNHSYVGSEHFLLGLLAVEDGVAAHVLKKLGVTLEYVRAEVINLLGAGQPPANPAEPLRLFDGNQDALIGELIAHFGKQLADLTRQKDEAVNRADYEKAAELRDQAITLVQFKELAIKIVLDTPINANSAGRPWGQHREQMFIQVAAALLESSPTLAARLGDIIKELRKAAEP